LIAGAELRSGVGREEADAEEDSGSGLDASLCECAAEYWDR